MNTIYLEPSKVPSHLRQGYNGNKFKAVVCTDVTIPADAGLWGGGSRETYHVIDLNTGRTINAPGQYAAPWDSSRREQKVELVPSIAIVEHSIFCGKDMGLTFYIHPDNAAKLLPAPQAELSAHEKIVLNATCSFKSSYGGRDRYQMAQDNYRYRPCEGGYPSREQWETAKASLIAQGLLNKAGAVTPAGRNANNGAR